MSARDGNQAADAADFTIRHYRELLRLAKSRYRFASYTNFQMNERFVLWRHDVDYSLNRAVRLAEIEHAEGVTSTYFINPHCEFYNTLEKSQNEIIRRLVSLDHELGIHFDAEYYDVNDEGQLAALMESEAKFFAHHFGVRVHAFSFHNPTPLLLTWENESYGGLLNCYSGLFKKSIPYCSDSNGYWRFRRLKEVLETATDTRLHVLTHPGWWQESQMSPRERIFRCIDGRAISVMNHYDRTLLADGRINVGCLDAEFGLLKRLLGKKASLLDSRWMRGEYAGVFIDAWRLAECKLTKWCRICLSEQIQAPITEVRALIESEVLRIPIHKVLAEIFQRPWQDLAGISESDFFAWQTLHDQIAQGRKTVDKSQLEAGIALLAVMVDRVNEHTEQNSIVAFSTVKAEGQGGPRQQGGAAVQWVERRLSSLGLDRSVWDEFKKSGVVNIETDAG